MADNETPDHKDATKHLALVRALSHEISSAIRAIERNDKEELASHIAAQEVICHKLNQKSTQALQLACESYRATSENPAEPSVFSQIREAYLALAHLNRVYDALLKRSKRSIEAMIGLYQSHGQRYSKDGSAGDTKRTWSCEA